jgi:CRISPR-associated endonuclease Cas2
MKPSDGGPEMSRRQRWLIAYDIRAAGARSRVAVLLSSHGTRIQKSVFIVRIPAKDCAGLLSAIAAHVDTNSDRVHAVLVPHGLDIVAVSGPTEPTDEHVWIV